MSQTKSPRRSEDGLVSVLLAVVAEKLLRVLPFLHLLRFRLHPGNSDLV